VKLALCNSAHSDRYDSPHYREDIGIGETAAENIAPGVRTEWAVESPAGDLLRCVVLYWQHYPGPDEALSLSAAPQWANPCADSTAATSSR
jgi:hypothetical protein